MITYKGKEYQTRQVIICPFGVAMPVTIARNELWQDIKGKAETVGSIEKAIDEHICYYCDETEWAMDDSHLVDYLESL